MSQRSTFITALLASISLHLVLLSVLLYHPASRTLLVALDGATSDFGERGAGDTLNYSPGDIPMAARQADANQVQLSRDPVGAGALRDLPSASVLPMSSQQISAPTMPTPAAVAPFGAPVISADFAQPTRKTSSQRPADPAPDAGTETDAFSKVGDVDFRDGKAEARIGRNVKT